MWISLIIKKNVNIISIEMVVVIVFLDIFDDIKVKWYNIEKLIFLLKFIKVIFIISNGKK